MAGQFQATLDSYTKTTATFSAAYVDLSTTGYDTMLIMYSTDSTFSTYSYATFACASQTSMIVQWSGCTITGLTAGQTYYWKAYPKATPTASTPSVEGSFTTESSVNIISGGLSPSSIVLGDSTQISWGYQGSMGSTGSWNFYRTDTATYINPTKIAQYNQSQSSPITFTPSQTGTWHIWVWHYDGDEAITSNIYHLGILTVTASVTHKCYIYDGDSETWLPATPYIYNGSGWVEATEYIYSGGWQ